MALLILLFLLFLCSLVCVLFVCDLHLFSLYFFWCRKRNGLYFELRVSYRHRCRWREIFRDCERWWGFQSWASWAWWLCLLVGLGYAFCVCALFGKSYYNLKLLEGNSLGIFTWHHHGEIIVSFFLRWLWLPRCLTVLWRFRINLYP